MKEIELDASAWASSDDFFSTLLSELGAPDWHGHNLDALWDSITSDINEVEPPFSIVLRHANHSSEDMTALFAQVSDLFAQARREGGVEVWFIIR